MDSHKAQELFLRYAPCMAFIAVISGEGDESIGSAFHVGDGIFVTARHVVEGLTICAVMPTHELRIPLQEAIPEYSDEAIDKIATVVGRPPTFSVFQKSLQITKGPFFHSNPDIDIAVFGATGLHPATPHVPLGSHLDDWVHRTNFILSEVLVLGYPPIPLTREPHLVASRAEVNAIVTVAPTTKLQFIVSATPRGGFSGGLALSEYGFALGLISSSLTRDHKAAELGFMSVLSVEPIYECLALHKLLPDSQKAGWNGFWNTENWDFVVEVGRGLLEQKANVSLYDDGQTIYVGLYCRESTAMERGLEGIALVLGEQQIDVTRTSAMHARIIYKGTYADGLLLAPRAVIAARDIMLAQGYMPNRMGDSV